MALNFRKKKNVPDELPDLISDEIEKESKSKISDGISESLAEDKLEPEKEIVEKSQESSLKDLPEPRSSFKRDEVSNESIVKRLVKNIEETPDRPQVEIHNSDEKSFFDELQENLTSELSDLDNLESWYDKKFNSRDILDDMKSYWEHQKKSSVLDALGKSYQEKISQKIDSLKNLEKEWQISYFELIEKEEEIKDQEKELKELLEEFVRVCKHKKEALGNKGTKGGENKDVPKKKK